jgi:hypothetical protein
LPAALDPADAEPLDAAVPAEPPDAAVVSELLLSEVLQAAATMNAKVSGTAAGRSQRRLIASPL